MTWKKSNQELYSIIPSDVKAAHPMHLALTIKCSQQIDGFFTAHDIARATNIGRGRVTRFLMRLYKAGYLERKKLKVRTLTCNINKKETPFYRWKSSLTPVQIVARR